MEDAAKSVVASYAEVAQLVGIVDWCGAQDPDAATAVFDHREYVHPRAGQGDRLKEVSGRALESPKALLSADGRAEIGA
ncbi:hypothetical protein [Streptomyces rugosispiralis]|uniref:hypothetical protein n=1 Tax=Streptomyces rugosispiralis TaxID=2967341 RepID=UPI003703AC11